MGCLVMLRESEGKKKNKRTKEKDKHQKKGAVVRGKVNGNLIGHLKF